MSESENITAGNFIKPDQLVMDLIETIGDENSEAGQELKDILRIENNCDYKAHLLQALQDPSSNLRQYIRQRFYPNGGQSVVGTAHRLFMNEASAGIHTSGMDIVSMTDSNVTMVPFKEVQKLNQGIFTKEDSFHRQGSKIVFNRAGNYQINVSLNAALYNGVNINDPNGNWRYTDTPLNRSVTIRPIIRIYGSLTGGYTVADIRLPTLLVSQSDILNKNKVRVFSTTTLNVLRSTGNRGRVESMELGIERSGTVMFFGVREDSIGLFKTTPSGTPDTSNFLDVIEL